jgi:outer membrane biosynthesis protein TonB
MDRYRRGTLGLNSARKRLQFAVLALLLSLMASSTPHLLAQNTSAPKPKRKVLVMTEPDYPFVLRNGHFEGHVRLEATVLPNGSVSKVECKGGNPMLAQYATQAVMRWKYAPGPAQTIEEAIFTFNANK